MKILYSEVMEDFISENKNKYGDRAIKAAIDHGDIHELKEELNKEFSEYLRLLKFSGYKIIDDNTL